MAEFGTHDKTSQTRMQKWKLASNIIDHKMMMMILGVCFV